MGDEAGDGEGDEGGDDVDEQGEHNRHPDLLQGGGIAVAVAHGAQGGVGGFQDGAEDERRDEDEVHGWGSGGEGGV